MHARRGATPRIVRRRRSLDHFFATIFNPEITGPSILFDRLNSIADALQRSGNAQALLALGSVGLEFQRIDEFSDIDFFLIVETGHKQRYIHNLDWLHDAKELEWRFQNTRDGHKAMMADGILCEFAVFEPHELAGIPFAPGRLVWSVDGFDAAIVEPSVPIPSAELPEERWIVGEALSCLLVGMQRWIRGERLSAARFIQVFALDRLIELDMRANPPAPGVSADPFNRDRRLEQRQASLARELPALMGGYSATPASAWGVLEALKRRSALIDGKMAERVQNLIRRACV